MRRMIGRVLWWFVAPVMRAEAEAEGKAMLEGFNRLQAEIAKGAARRT